MPDRLTATSLDCPHCGADLRDTTSGMTRHSRVVGVSDDRRDMVTAWLCPDCGVKDRRQGLPADDGRSVFAEITDALTDKGSGK